MALLAQPVERPAPEHDPVRGRRLRERRLDVSHVLILTSRCDTVVPPVKIENSFEVDAPPEAAVGAARWMSRA